VETEAKTDSGWVLSALGVALCLFTVAVVNYPMLAPQSQLAIFAMLALVLGFLAPHRGRQQSTTIGSRTIRWILVMLTLGVCTYVVIQTEPLFERFWIGGSSLGNRAGQETGLDTAVGIVGLLVVIEATRRSIGWALPILAVCFLLYAGFGSAFPDWLFPHRGYGVERIVAQTFLHSQGVFGTALRVMFVYVFLFVLFGGFLQASGATRFIIDFAQRVFGNSPGGPAKVAVLSSGLMGSLSGSAVANTATTGTFTIPMMRSAGFKPEIAGGVEAAASTGGALVPPVMGAGAYMMLELVDPPVTYLQIVRAALLPAVLYYLALLFIVHLYARRIGLRKEESGQEVGSPWRFEGLVFIAGFATLLFFLASGYTVFRAASLAIVAVIVAALFNPRTRIGLRQAIRVLERAARDTVPLVAAAACVGIVIGVVTLTGIGTRLPVTILSLSQGNLLSALALIMVSSIILGMGLPSAVCYLLMATLIGPVLGQLGVVPLAAHLFIFYFGMMSMVTPPVALAGYAAGSIAGAGIMQTSLAAFRFALVGFTLPYMFVLRPALLMLNPAGETAGWGAVVLAFLVAVAGIVPFAAGIAGHLFRPLSAVARLVLFVSAALLLVPVRTVPLAGIELPAAPLAGLLLFLVVGFLNARGGPSSA
jgi:TRAP transporter 4TM/12TM fusion protein